MTILNEGANLIAGCLNALAHKISRTHANVIDNNKKISAEQISEHYRKLFAIPILTDTVLRKGVYRNFSEFKLNRPYYPQFDIQKRKYSDILFVKDTLGNEAAMRDTWGYCDGMGLFIKATDNYFPMTRVKNSFYFRGFKDLERWVVDNFGRPIVIGGRSVFGGQKKPDLAGGRVSFRKFYKLYHVDMENGEIF